MIQLIIHEKVKSLNLLQRILKGKEHFFVIMKDCAFYSILYKYAFIKNLFKKYKENEDISGVEILFSKKDLVFCFSRNNILQFPSNHDE